MTDKTGNKGPEDNKDLDNLIERADQDAADQTANQDNPDQDSTESESNQSEDTLAVADAGSGDSIKYTGGVDTIEDQITPRVLEEEMKASYLNYAMTVIVSRALPDVRDGLKPVHRRILYAMHKLGLTPGAKYVKSARIVGDVLGKYHPHGDLSVYNALVRMAQDFSLLHPLVDGQGNFGSIDGDSPAAMRYTESRMSKQSPNLLSDIEKDTVDYADNYDGSQREPTVLPTMFPNLIVNGSTGIAVGMATEVPPHNLIEVCDALIMLLNNPDTTLEEIAKVVKGPDLPTGATIYGTDDMLEVYRTGRGKVVCRSTAELDDNRIIVTDVPYQVNKSNLLEKIALLVRDKRVDGIRDIRDESNKDGIRVVIETKRDASPEVVLNMLYKHTDLQKSIHYNMVALINRGRQPKLLGLREILTEFLAHRQEVVTRRTQFDLNKAEAELHILDGLKIAIDNIDRVIELIRASYDKEEAAQSLIKEFDLSDKQAEAILQMRLQALTNLDKQKIEDQRQALIKLIGELKAILENPGVMKKLIEDEIRMISAKLGKPRMTQVVGHSITNYNKEDLVVEEDVIVQLTEQQYLKWMPTASFRVQTRGGKGKVAMKTKDEDYVIQSAFTSTHDYVYAFTNSGRVFKTRVFDLPTGSRQSKGQNLINYFKLKEGEKIIRILTFTKDQEADQDGSLIFASQNGLVKRTMLDDFQNIRTTGIIAIKLRDGDALVDVRHSDKPEDNIIMSANNGKTAVFSKNEVRAMGRTASGVTGIKLKDDFKVISLDISDFNFDEAKQRGKYPALLVVTERGYGKQTYLGHYRQTKRAAAGVKTMLISSKTGRPVIISIVDGEEEELFVTTKNGIAIKTDPRKISRLGRATQGVRVINVDKSDTVISGGLS